MQYPENNDKFALNRIKIRKTSKVIPNFGTVRKVFGDYDYKFQGFKD